jgi:tRNA threonylcarbamoyl adenosine modification protein (Sua5/YciO/YrdC/YwlC family)
MEVIPLDRDVPETWTIGPAVRALGKGQLIVIPTDTIYALACDPWDAKAVGALYTAKGMDKNKRCAVLCQDQKAIGAVTRAVGDSAFRFMRAHLPGAFTILLHAAFDLPRRATGKRKTLGVRIPDNPVCQALTEEFGRPVLVTSVPGWENGDPVDPVRMAERLFLRPTVVLDQGLQVAEPSTVIDFTVNPPELVRQGKGEVEVIL